MSLKYISLCNGKFVVSDHETENSLAFEKRIIHILADQNDIDFYCFEKQDDVAGLTKGQLSSEELQKNDKCKKHSCTFWDHLEICPAGMNTIISGGYRTKESCDRELKNYESYIAYCRHSKLIIQDVELFLPRFVDNYYEQEGAFSFIRIPQMNSFEISDKWPKERVVKKALSVFTKKNSEYSKVGTFSLLFDLLKIANEGVLFEDCNSNYEPILAGRLASESEPVYKTTIQCCCKGANKPEFNCEGIDAFLENFHPKEHKEDVLDFIIDGRGVLNRYVGTEDEVVVPEGVKKIGEYAFFRRLVKKVVLPSSLTQIEDHAFEYCEKLEEVICSKKLSRIGTKAFFKCLNLKNFEFPNKLKKIGTRAFGNCNSLSISHLPESLDSIGEEAFVDCGFDDSFTQEILGLSFKNSMCIENDIVLYGTNANVKNLVVPDGVKFIYKGIPGKLRDPIFTGLQFLESVYIPDSVEAIDTEILFDCPQLKEVRLPEKIEFRAGYLAKGFFKNCNFAPDYFAGKLDYIQNGLIISGGVLWGCTNKHITQVVIPDGVKTINTYAFKDFSNLESVTIPEGVTKIEEDAFLNCCSLSNINFPKSLVGIGDRAFKNCNFGSDINCTLNNITMGLGILSSQVDVTFQDGFAIAQNTVLYSTNGNAKEIVIPDGIEKIGDFAFSENKNVESVKFPKSIKSIGRHAFEECNSLSSVDLPDSVETIEENAFAHCAISETFYKIVGDTVFQNGLCIKDNELCYCSNIHMEALTIPGRVEVMCNTLARVDNLKVITLPRTPVQIQDNGDLFPRGLKELRIPSYLKGEYSEYTFRNLNFGKVVKFINQDAK